MKKKQIILATVLILIIGVIFFASKDKSVDFSQISWQKIYAQRSCNATSTDGVYSFSIEWMPTGASPFGEPHQYVLNDIKGNSKTVLKVNGGVNPCALKWDKSGLYASEMVYEHIGQLEKIDLDSLLSGNIVARKMNGFGDGFISPDGQWYLFATNTDKGDGFEYCADELTRKSQSSLRLLNFLTGEIIVVAENKDNVFDIEGWSPDSKYILFHQFTLKSYPQCLCPEISGSGIGIARVYDLTNKKLIRVGILDVTR
jgi:hypothetical protein